MDSNCYKPLKMRINVFQILAIQVHVISFIILMSFVLLYLFIFKQVDCIGTVCTENEVLKISIERGGEFGCMRNPQWEQGLWQH